MTPTYGPYTPVRAAGNLLFVSGQVGIHPETKETSVDIAEQTRQALHNMEAALQAEGLNMQHVIKTTIFLTNMDNFAAMNEVYETMFPAPRPARSTVGVRELPRVGGDIPIIVEIEAVASREVV